MKKFLALIFVLTLALVFTACSNQKTTKTKIKTINLNFEDTKNIISATEDTLFVVNPDKTVSVAGVDHGNCNVGEWSNIEKIFATYSTTYGIQSDGTCLVAENYTWIKKPRYNNAIEITENFVLLSTGEIIKREGSDSELNTKILPKSIDILDVNGSLFCLKEDGKLAFYHEYYGRSDNLGRRAENINKNINKYIATWNNIKEMSYTCVVQGNNQGSIYTFVAVDGDGEVKVLADFYDDCDVDDIAKYNTWNNVSTAAALSGIEFIVTTKDNRVLACGGEFNEVGGEKPKILLPENALRVFNIECDPGGGTRNYVILICKDSSVVVYSPRYAMHKNISNAFSKWKSFEIS